MDDAFVLEPFRCNDGAPCVSSVEPDLLARGDGRDENSVVDGDGEMAQPKNVPNLEELGDLGSGLLISGVLLESRAVVGAVDMSLAFSTLCRLR